MAKCSAHCAAKHCTSTLQKQKNILLLGLCQWATTHLSYATACFSCTAAHSTPVTAIAASALLPRSLLLSCAKHPIFHHPALACTQVAKNSDVVFVSVKPQYVHTVLTEARPVLKDETLVISIAAGITVAQLLEAAGPNARVCRVMPNTPCLVGETAAAMCLGGKVRHCRAVMHVVESCVLAEHSDNRTQHSHV
jgi:pyrroline-5-carboxylate reductase